MFYWKTNRPLTAEESKNIFIEWHDKLNEDLLNKIVIFYSFTP